MQVLMVPSSDLVGFNVSQSLVKGEPTPREQIATASRILVLFPQDSGDSRQNELILVLEVSMLCSAPGSRALNIRLGSPAVWNSPCHSSRVSCLTARTPRRYLVQAHQPRGGPERSLDSTLAGTFGDNDLVY